MTEDEYKAYQWALNQNYQSVAARYAKILAKYIQKTDKSKFVESEGHANWCGGGYTTNVEEGIKCLVCQRIIKRF